MSDEPKKELPAVLASSADPAKLSLTIRGLALFVPAIVSLLAFFGIDVTPDSATEVINQVAVVAGGCAALAGIVRKIAVAKQSNENKQ